MVMNQFLVIIVEELELHNALEKIENMIMTCYEINKILNETLQHYSAGVISVRR